jgi:uncharacterized membrane protein YedE/YeeE
MATGIAFVLGALFALGLGISGLVRPEVIQGALDVTGNFDASLFIAFACAVLLYAPLARIAARRRQLELPTARRIDARLVGGAMLFGVGWGLAGTCPGPAVLWIVTLSGRALVFGLTMLAGMALFQLIAKPKKEA